MQAAPLQIFPPLGIEACLQHNSANALAQCSNFVPICRKQLDGSKLNLKALCDTVKCQKDAMWMFPKNMNSSSEGNHGLLCTHILPAFSGLDLHMAAITYRMCWRRWVAFLRTS
eukprot:1159427-Pelagomonas_calceolata.AAC.2